MIRDAVDVVNVYVDYMQSSTLQHIQSLVSIPSANSDTPDSTIPQHRVQIYVTLYGPLSLTSYSILKNQALFIIVILI